MSGIAIDVDGVLANFQQRFLKTAHELGYDNFPVHWTQWKNWNLEGLEKEFREIMKNLDSKPLWWLQINPYDDAYLTKTPDIYLTARPVENQITRYWLRINDFPETKVRTVNSSKEKPSVMEEEGVDCLLDDRPKTFSMINEGTSLRCILLDRPYNEHLVTAHDNRRVRNVYDFQQLFMT